MLDKSTLVTVNTKKYAPNIPQSTTENGWRVVTMEKDIRRMLLFFKREAYVVLMMREK
ncbi:DUF4177 domain-containing protein [Sulfurovum lithotrophicum]|nr:DUF4177 domain-containing protein [Sulfurovum lithotrophicum]